MPAIGGKADIALISDNVPFFTQSGHEQLGIAAVQIGS
jgi:hypothetical protein